MRRAGLILAFLLLLAGGAAAQPAVLVLDGSSSMWGRLDGRTKADTLREAVEALMGRWPAGRPVGLVAYGHRRARDCGDVELLRAPAPGAAAVAAQAGRIMPRGRTPIAESLRQAAEALGPGGGSVILVSDGVETCHPDPCAVAQQLVRTTPRLVVHSIAFAVAEPAAVAQLRCMAEVTGGRAMVARDAAQLAQALDRAAAQPVPGPRAESPRAEQVPQPRLIVTVRLCAECDPMTGDARIRVLRGGAQVAMDGEPFGRFLDLRAGDYEVTVETPLVRRGPVPVTVPPGGPGRVEVVLDAGWLVGDARSVPSGRRVGGDVRVALVEGGEEITEGAPAFLVPAGPHEMVARMGAIEARGAATVAAGDVALLHLPLGFGGLALRSEDFAKAPARLTITREGAREPVVEEMRAEAGVVTLPPGRYRVVREGRDGRSTADVEVRSEQVVVVVLRAED
ncbi:vWA domain-containing protein [Neoroseomonas oryzicola]|uniref:VWA domain-containing protein n=1 Tax=Neoroseomonas oryzicola TaxID=535904 RepID=A0A9X9WDQ4_9PROT|nr:VWA domain-containing protein [Neoroseomonas oryzicola]MBR0658464.1 VWA domain-containing protein [Neoroseomonas oryzicola]NKE17653.1 VWA domain-containing protein [Neoroseomonas oryzicola]